MALRGMVLCNPCLYTRDRVLGGARVARASGMAVSRATWYLAIGGAGWNSEPVHLACPVDARRQRVAIGESCGAASVAFEGNLLLAWV